MNHNNHHLSSLQTLTIDDCNFLQLIEKEEKRLDLEWQETYREMTRIESLINSYTALKLNLLAKLDTLELKKSEYVKKKTKLIGEMSCLPLPIDDFPDIHRFSSDDDLHHDSSSHFHENGSESHNSFSMDNIVADLLQTISEESGVVPGCGSIGLGGTSSSSLGSSSGNGTYERPESSSSITFSSGSSDYPSTNSNNSSNANGPIGRISSPQSTVTLGNQIAVSTSTLTTTDHHTHHHNHYLNNNQNNNQNNNNNNNNINNNNNNNINSKPVTAASIVSNMSGNSSNSSTISNASSKNGSINNNSITNNGHHNINHSTENEESCSTGSNGASSQVVGPPPRFSSNRSYNSHKVQYNSVLSLETSNNGYVYKALNDGTVMRYKFNNPSDNQIFSGHKDKVKVLILDSKSQVLYTGCDDGNVRSFNANSGQLLNQFSCDGIVISIDKSSDEFLVFATNKGWIYLVNYHNFKLISSHRTFNWIFAVRNILYPFKDNTKRLLVVPMKHKPTVVEASTGKILQEIGSQTIESRPCLQVNGSIAIIATVVDKSENGTSQINVYDSASNWKCIKLIKKEGLITSMCTHGHDLYVGIKFPSYGHIQCFKWSNRSLYLKWVACVAYVHTLSVMSSDVHNLSIMPSDIVLNGGPDGNVYNTTPNLKGPFFCMNKKCDCKLPFARRKDLDFHYAKLQSS